MALINVADSVSDWGEPYCIFAKTETNFVHLRI